MTLLYGVSIDINFRLILRRISEYVESVALLYLQRMVYLIFPFHLAVAVIFLVFSESQPFTSMLRVF